MDKNSLPEITRAGCIGPGHVDLVEERINEAIGIAEALATALRDPDNQELQPNIHRACLGQARLLEEAIEHLNAYELEVAERHFNKPAEAWQASLN